jgi:hypothetical protein
VRPSRWLTLGSCAVTPQDPVTSAGASSLHWRPALNYTNHDERIGIANAILPLDFGHSRWERRVDRVGRLRLALSLTTPWASPPRLRPLPAAGNHTAVSWAPCRLPAPGVGGWGALAVRRPRRPQCAPPRPRCTARPHAWARGSRDALAVPSFVHVSATPSSCAFALQELLHLSVSQELCISFCSLAARIASLLQPAGGHQRGPAAGVGRGGPRPGQACARTRERADPRRGDQREQGGRQGADAGG